MGHTFDSKFSAAHVERLYVSTFGDTVREVDGTNTKELLIRRLSLESRILQHKQLVVEADAVLCAQLSYLARLLSPGPQCPSF